MTVYTGSTFQTCALRVWGVWVSMRDLNPQYEHLLPAMSGDREVNPPDADAARCSEITASLLRRVKRLHGRLNVNKNAKVFAIAQTFVFYVTNLRSKEMTTCLR